jgi:alkanesulfonate monooxygenase SsuD/methylene tetrahydromethanopterin reductase-like flavin-dependent oxidoreductase (luciferase family)
MSANPLLGVTIYTTTDTELTEQAQLAEALGFDFVSASDHPCGTNPTYETWTMLTWMAANTRRIRIASRVLGVPYRSPAMTAKMAETLDRLSGGRLILGLGGGYSDEEFRAFGLRVPTARDKVDGLAEAIAITRGLWSKPGFSFAGRLYQTIDADLEPKPTHRIPIWLGTFGDRALRVTGELADGWIPSLGYAPAGRLPAMLGQVLAAAQAAGRSQDDITCALNLEVHVGDGVDPRPSLIAGSPDQIVTSLRGFMTAGFTAFNFTPAGKPASDQMKRIAAEVVPRLRAG